MIERNVATITKVLVCFVCICGASAATQSRHVVATKHSVVAHPAVSSAKSRIVVDFSVPLLGRGSMTGFTNGIGLKQPPDRVVVPLKPAIWHSGSITDYDRATRLGARYELDLSAGWGLPTQKGAGNGKWPYDDYDAWEAYVRSSAKSTIGKHVIFDIWPIADLQSWGGSRAQWFETLRRASLVLQQVLGSNVVYSAPGIKRYDPKALADVLDYAIDHKIPVPLVSWSEDGQGLGILNISKDVHDAKSLLNLPQYKSLHATQINISTSTCGSVEHDPGDALALLATLEGAGVRYATESYRAAMSTDFNACSAPTLNGLLIPGTLDPTPAYWAVRAYADGVGFRVWSVSTNPQIVSIASARGAVSRMATVALGYIECERQEASADIQCDFIGISALPWMHAHTKISVSLIRIPDLPNAPLMYPSPIASEILHVVHNRARLDFSGMVPGEVYVIQITAA